MSGRQDRKEQARFGTRAGMSQKTKEMPVYDRPSSFYSTKTNEVEAPGETGIQDLRLQTDGQGRDGISDLGGQPIQTNPTGLSSGGSIR